MTEQTPSPSHPHEFTPEEVEKLGKVYAMVLDAVDREAAERADRERLDELPDRLEE